MANLSDRRGTVVSSIINLLATAMGGGLLSLPHALAECGALLGSILLVGSAIACAYSLVILVMCGRDSGRNSFEGNAEHFLGQSGAKLLNISLVVLLIFASATMSVIMMDLAPLVLVELLGKSPFLNRVFVGICMNLLMFPLSSQKTMHVLRYTSFCALLCIGYFFVCLVFKFFENPHVEASVVAIGEPDQIMEGLPIMFSAFLCQFNIFKIDSELREEDRTKITRVVFIAISVVAVSIYVAGGLLGYSLLGAEVSNNLLKDFAGDPKFTVARLLLSFTNMFKVPLLMIPLRESVVEMLGLNKGVWDKPLPRYMLTFLLGALSFELAVSLQSLSKVLGLLGCTSGVLIAFVLPGSMFLEHLRRTEEQSGSRLRSFSDLTVLGSQSADDGLLALNTSLIEGKIQSKMYPNSVLRARKATAWLLIISAIVAGLSSLASMIANWKSA